MTEDKIRFEPWGREVTIHDEACVLDVALKNGVDIPHSCGGMGSCTTCRVIVIHCPQALPPRNELECDIANMRGFADNERLSCQLPPVPGLVVRVPKPSAPPET